jgi:hypothetical protein
LIQKRRGEVRDFNEEEEREGEGRKFNYFYVWFKRGEGMGGEIF